MANIHTNNLRGENSTEPKSRGLSTNVISAEKININQAWLEISNQDIIKNQNDSENIMGQQSGTIKSTIEQDFLATKFHENQNIAELSFPESRQNQEDAKIL